MSTAYTGPIKPGSLVLFQGDSITDAGRSYDNDGNLGYGYANMVAAWFTALHPELGLRFVNKGISGHRVKDLQARWQRDTLDYKPGFVSILIGINDTWRRYDSNDPTSAEDYEAGYRDILTRTKESGAGIMVLEPFVLPYPADRVKWREDLDPKIDAARRLAREFGAIYVPMDGLYAAASTRQAPEVWAGDGVHPSQAGHALMAQAWLRAVNAM